MGSQWSKGLGCSRPAQKRRSFECVVLKQGGNLCVLIFECFCVLVYKVRYDTGRQVEGEAGCRGGSGLLWVGKEK